MTVAKIAITLDEGLLAQVDHFVAQRLYPNRSRAIQAALAEKVIRLNKTRLARECARLDPQEEQEWAELGHSADLAQWPEY